MDFVNANPMFVTLVVAGIVAAWLLLLVGARRRRRLVREWVGERLAPSLTCNLDPGRRRWRGALLVGALVLLGVAAARPWWGYQLQNAPARSRDVLLAVDCSRSMLAEDVSPSRLEHAKWWIREVARACPGDRFGLIAFAGTAFLECPLTQDRNTLFQFLDDLDSRTVPVGGTNVQEALATAREAFEGAEGPFRAVVLISDGGEQQGSAAQELNRFESAEIPLLVVGIGDPARRTPIRTEEGKYLRDEQGDVVETTLHEGMLRQLAASTGSLYVRSTAVTPNTAPVVDRIRDLVPQRREGDRTRRPRERYQVPLALAILLLLARMALGERRRPALAAAALAFVGSVVPGPGFAQNAQAPDVADSAAAATRNSANVHLEEAAALEQELSKAKGREAARLAFNLGVLKHESGDVEAAESLYRQAMDHGAEQPRVATRAAQNLGALKQRQAENTVREDPDKALELLDRAEAYNREALRQDPANDGAARNQERLLKQREFAEELKQRRQQLDKQRKKAQEETKQAEQQQQQANQTPQGSGKQEKQEEARQQTQKAHQATRKLKEMANSADDQQMQQRAEQAEQEVRKAQQAQRNNRGEEAKEHLRKAREHLGSPTQEKTDTAQQDNDKPTPDNGEEPKTGPDSSESGQPEPTDNGADQDIPQASQTESQQGTPDAQPQALPEDIDESVARALLLQMLEEEEDLREALKARRARNRKLKPVEKDW